MEITTTTVNRDSRSRSAITALAIVGFIALILIGIGLAIYTARFMPEIASRFGSASVFSSIFHKAGDEPSLDVVTATTTLPILDGDTAVTVATSTESNTGTANSGSGTHTGSTGSVKTVTTVVTSNVTPYGKSDLSVRITDIGYVTRKGDTDTFVSSDEVPRGKDGAVKFTVKNIGTNTTGSWKFEVDVPTSPAQHFTSPNQQSLAPGDSIDYVLGFQNGKKGSDRDVIVTVDSRDQVNESDERNNEASRSIDIKG